MDDDYDDDKDGDGDGDGDGNGDGRTTVQFHLQYACMLHWSVVNSKFIHSLHHVCKYCQSCYLNLSSILK